MDDRMLTARPVRSAAGSTPLSAVSAGDARAPVPAVSYIYTRLTAYAAGVRDSVKSTLRRSNAWN